MSNNESNKKLAAIYVRQASVESTEKSIINQLNMLRNFARANNYKVVVEYLDSCGGHTLGRPGLTQLRKDVSDKKWSMLLVADHDRLSRNFSDYFLLTKELKDIGCEVVFMNGSQKELTDAIVGWFAMHEMNQRRLYSLRGNGHARHN